MTQTKQDIREKIKLLKSQLSLEAKANEAKAVFETVEALRAYKNAENILLYASLPDELPTESVLHKWALTKKLYLPRVVGNDIEVVKLDGALTSGAYGIQEPTGKAVDPNCLDLIVVPAVALDSHCNRLGRGKGFYDRLLKGCKAFTIGVALDEQFIAQVPTDEYDVPLCGVVTPSHVSFRKSYTAYLTEKNDR